MSEEIRVPPGFKILPRNPFISMAYVEEGKAAVFIEKQSSEMNTLQLRAIVEVRLPNRVLYKQNLKVSLELWNDEEVDIAKELINIAKYNGMKKQGINEVS